MSTYSDEELEDLLIRMAHVFWQIGTLPVDYQMELTKAGVDYEWFVEMCRMFHPNPINKTIH